MCESWCGFEIAAEMEKHEHLPTNKFRLHKSLVLRVIPSAAVRPELHWLRFGAVPMSFVRSLSGDPDFVWRHRTRRIQRAPVNHKDVHSLFGVSCVALCIYISSANSHINWANRRELDIFFSDCFHQHGISWLIIGSPMWPLSNFLAWTNATPESYNSVRGTIRNGCVCVESGRRKRKVFSMQVGTSRIRTPNKHTIQIQYPFAMTRHVFVWHVFFVCMCVTYCLTRGTVSPQSCGAMSMDTFAIYSKRETHECITMILNSICYLSQFECLRCYVS